MAINHASNIRRGITPIVALLIIAMAIVPLAAAAPITVTPSKTTYNPGDTLTVSGTATPNSAVTIQVFNPAGNIVGLGQGSTDSEGRYTITVFVWPLTPTLKIPFGTYSVKATDAANGDSVSTTVEFAQLLPPPPPPAKLAEALVHITISTSETYQLGETARIFVLFTYNGSKVDPTATVVLIHPPGITPVSRTLTRIHSGLYYLDYTPVETGTYAVHVEATAKGTTNVEIVTFQVTQRLATASDLTTLGNDLTTKLDTVQKAVTDRIALAQDDVKSKVASAQSALSSAITNAQDDIKTSISNTQSALSGAISSAKNDLNNRISSAQDDIKSTLSSIEGSIKSQISSTEQSIKSAVNGVQSAVVSAVSSAVSSAVQPLKGDISNAQSTLSNTIQQVRSDIDGVESAVDSLKSNIESVNAGVASSTTWIMVVGILAAITLVLELAILIRRAG